MPAEHELDPEQPCYLCAQGPLAWTPGEERWGGLWRRPARWHCLACGAQGEAQGQRVRFRLIPAPYAALVASSLAGWVTATQAATTGAAARRFLAARAAIERGESWDSPLRLDPAERCLYASEEEALLFEQRTRANQPYWAKVRNGPLVLTERALYVGLERLPWELFGVLEQHGEELWFTRHDRPQLQRLVFPNAATAHLALLVLAQRFPQQVSPPALGERPERRHSGA